MFEGDPETQKIVAKETKFYKERPALIAIGVVTMVGSVALLILSGIGYLRQTRIGGRMMGSGYAVLALLAVLAILAFGGEFVFEMLLSIFYPLFTLFLVNSIFKDDLVN